MPLLNYNSYWYFDTQGPNNNKLVKEERKNSMFRRLKDWDAEPDDYYLIEFKSIISVQRVNFNSVIPDDIMSRIKDPTDNCYLILENFHEGFSNIIAQLYDSVINRYSIPAEKLYLYTGALDIQEKLDRYVEKHKVAPFRLATMLEFELSTQARWENDLPPDMELPNTLCRSSYQKKYLNFNRRWRLHRPMLTALLKATDLLDKGYVSLAPSDDARGWGTEMDHCLESCREHKGVHRVLTTHRKSIENMGPLYLDKPDLTINYAPLELTPEIKKMYEHTYFSVVSETIYFTKFLDWEDSCFLSEKIFKAILFKHPFILVATPNTLKYLKAIGYKTFHPVIDESYDSIEDNYERMIAIVKEINRLCKLEGAALESYQNYCRKIVEHNFKVLTSKKVFTYEHS